MYPEFYTHFYIVFEQILDLLKIKCQMILVILLYALIERKVPKLFPDQMLKISSFELCNADRQKFY